VTPSESEERDAELIDRLYGGDESDDLGELRGVRELIARVRDEAPGAEPSPAISASLLQAARARAPKEGLWARLRAWLLPITMHPGLAAAATLVIVVGAAAIWMRGGGEIAEPTRDDKAAAPAAPAEEAVAEAEQAPPAEPVIADPAPVAPAGAAGEKQDGAEPPARPTKRPPRKPKAEPTRRDVADDADLAVKGTVTGTVGGVRAEETKKEAKPAPRQEETVTPVPPPPPPSPTADSGGALEQVQAVEPPSPTERARALTRQAKAEAGKKNCKNIESYAKQVRGLDRKVHDDEFAKDPAIAACRTRSGQ